MAGPKKITPYLLFSTESRERAKQQLIDAGDPKPGMGDIAKTVGVMWHALGDDGKEVRRDFPSNERPETTRARSRTLASRSRRDSKPVAPSRPSRTSRAP